MQQREMEYDYREMYKKMIRKYKKTNGNAPDPQLMIRNQILKDTQLIKLRTGRVPIDADLLHECSIDQLQEDSVQDSLKAPNFAK